MLGTLPSPSHNFGNQISYHGGYRSMTRKSHHSTYFDPQTWRRHDTPKSFCQLKRLHDVENLCRSFCFTVQRTACRGTALLSVAGLEARQNRRLYASLSVFPSPSDVPIRADMKRANGIYSELSSLLQNTRQ